MDKTEVKVNKSKRLARSHIEAFLAVMKQHSKRMEAVIEKYEKKEK